MEYIDGSDLATLIEKTGATPLPRFMSIFSQLCSALAYLHSQRIVHRDIQPANLMLDSEGTLKLIDFGIARQYATESSKPSSRCHEHRVLRSTSSSPSRLAESVITSPSRDPRIGSRGVRPSDAGLCTLRICTVLVEAANRLGARPDRRVWSSTTPKRASTRVAQVVSGWSPASRAQVCSAAQ